MSGRSAQRPFMISISTASLQGRAARPRAVAISGRAARFDLPANSAPVVAVTHGYESDQRRAEHQIRIAIFVPLRAGPSQHSWVIIFTAASAMGAGRKRQRSGRRDVLPRNSISCVPSLSLLRWTTESE